MAEDAESKLTPEQKKKFRMVFWGLYFAIALIFTVYSTYFGDFNHRSFFFNFGRSLVWPFLLFPVVGKIVGAIFLVLLIIIVMALG